MKRHLKLLMGLLVASMAFGVTGQEPMSFRQVAKMTFKPSRSRLQAEQTPTPKGLSRAERVKRGLEMLSQDVEVGNWDRMRASIDMSQSVSEDWDVEMLELATAYWGQGNAKTAITTVDLWQVPTSKRSRLTLTFEDIDPSRNPAVSIGVRVRFRF